MTAPAPKTTLPNPLEPSESFTDEVPITSWIEGCIQMNHDREAVIIAVMVAVGAGVLATLGWWAAHNKSLRESRQVAALVRTTLHEVQDRMQKDAPSGVVLVHSGGGGSRGDQVHWTSRWEIAAIQVDMDDPKSSTKQQIVDLQVRWRYRPDAEAIIKWGEAPSSREAAETLGSLLKSADVPFSIRESVRSE